MKFQDYLKSIGACQDAVDWVGDRDPQTAWAECHRPDWMLWLDEKLNLLTDKQRRHFACDCAEAVLPIFENQCPNDDRPRKAIEVARRFANGKATDEERAAAWAAARDASRDAAGAAAGDAAWAAAWDAAAKRLREYLPKMPRKIIAALKRAGR